jgi:urease accessory protein
MTAAIPIQTASVAARQPRAEGAVRIIAHLRDRRAVLAGLRQRGSAKALFPYDPSGRLVGVLLDTAGGLTGGDRFAWEV